MKTVKALFIPVEGDMEVVVIKDEFKTISSKMGVDYIDVVWAGDAGFYVDDEGLINGSPINMRASKLYDRLAGREGAVLAGNVLVVGAPDDEGWDRDVPESVLSNVNIGG